MKTKLVVVFVLVLAIGFGASYAVTAMKNKPNSSKTSCERICVALEASGANPKEISVPVGEYVQINSADGKSHNLSRGKGGDDHDHSGKFFSGEFSADEAWKVQFTEDGSYFLHDHFNPNINVLVVVYEPGKDYKIN